MRYRRLGSTGALVSEIVLGSATFGELTTAEAVDALVDLAVDEGVNAIDTGDIYAGGASERAVGRALARHADRMLVFTKVGYRVGDSVERHADAGAGRLDDAARWREGISPNDQGLSRLHVVRAVHESLRRLGRDHLDLYQVHRWDDRTPIEETLHALDDLVRAGTVRYVGCSDLAGWRLVDTLWAAERERTVRFATMQVPLNLLHHERAEGEQLPACAAHGVGALVYQPLAGGMLTGRYDRGAGPEAGSRLAARPGYRDRYWNDATFTLVERLAALALELGRAPAELALGWILARPAVSAVLVGAERPEEFHANLGVARRPLTPDELAAVEDLLADPLATPAPAFAR